MVSILWVSVALVLLFAAGVSLQSWLLPRAETYWFEYWSLAFLLGTAAMCGLWMLLSPLYTAINPAPLLTLAAALLLAASRSRLRLVFPRRVSSWAAVDVLLALILCVELAMIVAASLHSPLGWDGVFNFEMKARLIYENDPIGQLPSAYLSDTSRTWSHPQYPLMLPFAEFWVYSWLGRVDQSAIKILFPLFYMSAVGLLAGSVRRFASSRTALLTAVALGLLPPLTYLPGAASGYADVPLATALTGAVSFAYRGLVSDDADALRGSGVLCAIAGWTKLEGLILGCSLGVLALALGVALRRRGAVAALAIPLVLMAPWIIVQRLHGIPSGDFAAPANGLFGNMHRLPDIAGLVFRELLRPGHWGLLWPCWLMAIGLQRPFDRRTIYEWLPIAAVILPLSFYFVVFSFSAWPDVTEHVRLAMPRLLVPLAPVALMSTVLRVHAAYHHA
jgi:hypothetical protein